jgi:hypothetical protein
MAVDRGFYRNWRGGREGVNPRDVAWMPLDPGGMGGRDWFAGSDPWEGREDQSERVDFSIFCARCALLLFFSRLKRISAFWGVGSEIPNLAPGKRNGFVICLLISHTSPFSYDDCCLYPSSFFVVYILVR